MAKRTKRVKRHDFTDAQETALTNHVAEYGHTNQSARQVLKLAAFRYPGAPRRTVASIASKLRRISKDKPKSKTNDAPYIKSFDTSDNIKQSAPVKSLSFVGEIKGDILELTITTNISNLRSLM